MQDVEETRKESERGGSDGFAGFSPECGKRPRGDESLGRPVGAGSEDDIGSVRFMEYRPIRY